VKTAAPFVFLWLAPLGPWAEHSGAPADISEDWGCGYGILGASKICAD